MAEFGTETDMARSISPRVGASPQTVTADIAMPQAIAQRVIIARADGASHPPGALRSSCGGQILRDVDVTGAYPSIGDAQLEAKLTDATTRRRNCSTRSTGAPSARSPRSTGIGWQADWRIGCLPGWASRQRTLPPSRKTWGGAAPAGDTREGPTPSRTLRSAAGRGPRHAGTRTRGPDDGGAGAGQERAQSLRRVRQAAGPVHDRLRGRAPSPCGREHQRPAGAAALAERGVGPDLPPLGHRHLPARPRGAVRARGPAGVTVPDAGRGDEVDLGPRTDRAAPDGHHR